MTATGYLGPSHPLAVVARRLCRSAHRLGRGSKLGGVACGRCWERAIRSDERVALAFGLGSPHPAADSGYVDEVAVDRYRAGELLRLTPAERREIARRSRRSARRSDRARAA